MTFVYNSPKEIFDKIEDRYKDAESLSRADYGCAYSHETNGIGCAIGCLIDANLADKLDTYEDNIVGINTLYANYLNINDERFTEFQKECVTKLFEHYFNMKVVSFEFLTELQRLHDTCYTVEDFLTKVNTYKGQFNYE